MEKYNYYKAIKEDIRSYISANLTNEEIQSLIDNRETNEEDLYNCLWVDDSVTGNASGSYTFNRWEAEENLCHNLDLLSQALWEFGYDNVDILSKGAEWCDVTIRCYLLSEALAEVLDYYETII